MARQASDEGLSTATTETAREIIARLDLSPHPEGGWYRETWRAPPGADGRAGATAILFLLDTGQHSHWHRVDADELWLWHDGAAVQLQIAAGGEGPITTHRLDRDAPQQLVLAHHWQAAEAADGWALMSCVVVPGFDFASFTLAPPGWSPS